MVRGSVGALHATSASASSSGRTSHLRYTETMPRPTAPSLTLVPDPVIEAYKKDIDRTLLRETLKRTPAQRLERLQEFVQTMARIRGAARRKA
jgi:hypothetical protein